MAQGVTSSFTEDVSFTSKFQMTKNDDVLNIIGATVTLRNPAGDLFTNEGNDNALIEDSMLVLEGVNLAFYLGSGDDTLTVNNSTISAPIVAGSGNDAIFIGLAGSTVFLNSELTFGSGDDVLELIGALEVIGINGGSIDFGASGSKTLRFNGGVLSGMADVIGITDLEIMVSGGTLARDYMALSGEETSITFYGDLLGTLEDTQISISESTTTLHVEKDASTNIGLVFSNASLIHKGEGILSLENSYKTYQDRGGILFDNSDINLKNIQARNNQIINYDRNQKDYLNSYGGWYTGPADNSAFGGCMVQSRGTANITNALFTSNCVVAWGFSPGLFASGGAIVLNDGIMNLTDNTFSNNSAVASGLSGSTFAYAYGGAIFQNAGIMNLTNASFINNRAIVAHNGSNYAQTCAFGGAICINDGTITLMNAQFEGNQASHGSRSYGSEYGGAIYQSGGTMTLMNNSFSNNGAWLNSAFGGAIFLSSVTANIEDTTFTNNSAACGGAIFLENSVLNYKVATGKDIVNIGNKSMGERYGCGGFLCCGEHSTVNILVETNAKLTIGEQSYDKYMFDSIASVQMGLWGAYTYNASTDNTIFKKGAGFLLINASIDGYKGQWIVSDGIIELSHTFSQYETETEQILYTPLGRNIVFDDWTIEEKGMLVLSSENDTINMSEKKVFSGILDTGDGDDTINTNGFEISEGTILFHNVSIHDGQINATLHNPSTTEGCSFTLNGSVLNSDYSGTDLEDDIIINGESTINGLIDMAGGINSIQVNGTLNMNNAIKICKGGETSVYAYYGSAIADNSLTVYADAEATRDTFTLDWSDQTDLDKVRILVSTDSTFETFEFNLELYNQTKSFTMDLQQGYFIQFQAQDEDGWKQRLLADTTAPNQVTGITVNGDTLRWDETHDNPGGNGVMQYHVEVASDAAFTTVLQSGIVTTPEFALNPSAEGTLYIRVKAEDYTGNTGAWSETLKYDVIAIDSQAPIVTNILPSITIPTNQNVTITAEFSDNVSVAKAMYKIGDGEWTDYPAGGVVVAQNTTVSFKAIDSAGNESAVEKYTVNNIDKVAPTISNITPSTTEQTNSVIVTANFTDDVELASKQYKIGSNAWMDYTTGVFVTENTTIFFKAVDTAGNETEDNYIVTNIETVVPDTTSPTVSNIQASITTLTNQDVVLTADFTDDVELAQSLYKLGKASEWTAYVDGVTVKENVTVYFKAIDVAGNESDIVSYTVNNIDKVAPSDPTGLGTVVSGQKVALVWDVSTDDFSGLKEYIVTYSINEQVFSVRTSNTNYVLNNADFGDYSWTVQAVDFAGNESGIIAGDAFVVSGFKPYTVEYSPDNFEHKITFAVTTPSLDAFRMPGGTYQMRVKQEGSSEWITGDPIIAEKTGDAPQLIKSDSDGNADVFFANSIGTWESGYLAQHVGSINDWTGTNEYAAVFGKNKLADIIEGSTDANILLMTDDDNGDSLFVDDIYTALPGSVTEQQSRIAQIDEIRAGAGNDIVDMTSQRFEYAGDGLTIRGGTGNDTIWANKGDNKLFGDAGNDRVVGASGNDVIAGGIGNDRMHGGGGNDVFTFCDNWGVDNVEQLAGGSVTLWFASGDESKWDEATLTYADGENSVKVSGVAAEKVTLKFGDDGTAQFASLTSMGAFFDATTERIFEESGKGMLACL